MRIHTGEKPYLCGQGNNVCSEKSKSEKTHEITHRRKTFFAYAINCAIFTKDSTVSIGAYIVINPKNMKNLR